MTAEAITSDQAIAVLRPNVPVTQGMQRISQGDVIGTDEAEIIDTAVAELQEALGAAGYGGTVPADGAVVEDGQVLSPSVNGTARELTLTVADGAVTAVQTAATVALVQHGQTFEVTGGTVTLAVAANVVTATFTPTEP